MQNNQIQSVSLSLKCSMTHKLECRAHSFIGDIFFCFLRDYAGIPSFCPSPTLIRSYGFSSMCTATLRLLLRNTGSFWGFFYILRIKPFSSYYRLHLWLYKKIGSRALHKLACSEVQQVRLLFCRYSITHLYTYSQSSEFDNSSYGCSLLNRLSSPLALKV